MHITRSSGYVGATRRRVSIGLGALLAVPTVALLAAPGAQAASRTATVTGAAAYAKARGYHVGIAVLDTSTGQFYGAGDYSGTFASESVVKVFIATRLLVSGRMYGTTKGRAYKMITQSDDSIASSFYGSVGGDGLINWIKARYHEPDLGYAPSASGWWGNTHIRPAGLVRLYAKLKKDKVVGPWLLNAMHHASTYGSDGTYQFFGIPSATRGAAIKQGWGDDYDDWSNSADFNTTGFVNGDRYTMAILARGPISSYGSRIGGLLTAVARRLMPNGVFPDVAPTVTGVSVTSGPATGGNRVTVYGTNFTHVQSVKFGYRPGSRVKVLSPTRLQVTAPRYNRQWVNVHVITTHGANAVSAHSRYLFENAPRVGKLGPASGPVAGGSRVTVHGAAFTHVTKVLFGATPAHSFVTRSRWQLQAVAPRHVAGPVTVRVVSGYGSGVSTYRFTYVAPAPPPPTATGITPNAGPTAGGTRVQITGTEFTPASTVRVDGVAASNVVVAADGTSLTATVPAHPSGTVEVRVITASGQSGPVSYLYADPEPTAPAVATPPG